MKARIAALKEEQRRLRATSKSMVLRFKKLFQASASNCVLDSSKINCHAKRCGRTR